MKAISENLYRCGKSGTLYVRRRIPASLRAAYPAHQEHIARSLHTSDVRNVKERARAELTRIDIEFHQKRQELDLSRASLNPKQVSKLEDEQLQSVVFLRSVIETLDHQLARQRGELVDTGKVAPATTHPLHLIAPERTPENSQAPTWEKVFVTWRDYVQDRPMPTTIASQTPWRALECFEKGNNAHTPGEVTPELMTAFAHSMLDRGLQVVTINERISKVRAIYRIAVGKHVLKMNPAGNTLGFKESGVKKRKKRRLPFDTADLTTLFSSEVFTQHKRSRGQAGDEPYRHSGFMPAKFGIPDHCAPATELVKL